MNIQELRNKISNQKVTKQPFLFKDQIDLDAKLLKPLCLSKIFKRLKFIWNL